MLMRRTSLILTIIMTLLAALSLSGCADTSSHNQNETTIRIISTSDIHGKMLAYDYVLDKVDKSGSLAQASSAINEYRNENTILVDLGDSIQGNLADIFNDEPVHPMVQGMNAIGYDIFVTGNHEYNFGTDITKKYIETCDGDVLLGNVYDESGLLLTDSYKIIEKNGIRLAFIGMVTHNIIKWDKDNLSGYTVTDPAEETNRIIDALENDVKAGIIEPVDILIGAFHVMDNDEYDVDHSGYISIAKSCPRLNLILGAHGHDAINNTLDGGITVTENLSEGRSIQIVDITFNDDSEHKPAAIKEIVTKCVETGGYPEDEKIVKLLAPYDKTVKELIKISIGKLEGGPLVPDGEIKAIHAGLLGDTPLQTLIQHAMMYYSGADIAISAPSSNEDNAYPGDLTIADISSMYKFSNSLYTVRMSGAQLKKYLEWSACFYQEYQEGDLIIAFEDIPVYMCDSATGVKYDIDISKPAGERIKNLTYADGKVLNDNDELTVAVNDYRYNTSISSPGVIFDEEEIPELLEIDVRGDIGSISLLIADYIKNVQGGTITPECDNNWKIIGTGWDKELHEKAVEMINNGQLHLEEGSKKNPCINKITVNDI